MTREEAKKERRTARRKAREADRALTDAVRALGAGDADDWPQGDEEQQEAVSGQHSASGATRE